MSPCAPKGFSNYLRQIYAILTFSHKDWMPQANFGVCNVYGFKWGRHGSPKLGKILGKMKKAVKNARSLPKILSPRLWKTLAGTYNFVPQRIPQLCPKNF